MAHDISDIWEARRRQLADELPWIWLYEFEVPTDPPTRYRFTNQDTPINFGQSDTGVSITYYPFPIVHGPLEETDEGDLPQIQVQVGYPDLEMRAVLDEHNGLTGQRAVVRLVHAAALDDPGSQLRFDGQVTSTRILAGGERVAMTISSRNLKQHKMPSNKYSRLYCRHQYGGPECGFNLNDPALVLAHPSCPKTISACKERGDTEVANGLPRLHPLRFGGWPSVPRRTRS